MREPRWSDSVSISRDSARMRAAAFQSDQGVASIDSILNVDPSDPNSGELARRRIPWVMQSDVFNPEFDEFEALQSSGRLGLIEDPDLVNALTGCYGLLEYVAEMYRYDIEQSHKVAELMYPHIEFPRSRYVLDSLPLFPPPEVAPSLPLLISDPVFVNEMSHRSRASAQRAAELLEVIEGELDGA